MYSELVILILYTHRANPGGRKQEGCFASVISSGLIWSWFTDAELQSDLWVIENIQEVNTCSDLQPCLQTWKLKAPGFCRLLSCHLLTPEVRITCHVISAKAARQDSSNSSLLWFVSFYDQWHLSGMATNHCQPLPHSSVTVTVKWRNSDPMCFLAASSPALGAVHLWSDHNDGWKRHVWTGPACDPHIHSVPIPVCDTVVRKRLLPVQDCASWLLTDKSWTKPGAMKIYTYNNLINMQTSTVCALNTNFKSCRFQFNPNMVTVTMLMVFGRCTWFTSEFSNVNVSSYNDFVNEFTCTCNYLKNVLIV